MEEFRTYKFGTKTEKEAFDLRQLRFHDLFTYINSINFVTTNLPLSANGKKVVDIRFNRDNHSIDLITEI